ncbi:MAG: hypothetical protein NXI20_10485 [bacterium]|nr:hypothetical protein [bacterium]
MKFTYFTIIVSIIIFSACNNDEEPEPEPITIDVFSGLVQKGPFLNGSSVIISELNESASQTGISFNTTVSDNSGYFEVTDLTVNSPFIQVSGSGNYFNEILGSNSTNQITLLAFSDISENETVNVNVLTHLEVERTKFLIGQGLSFNEAKDSAQFELLNAFGIWNEQILASEELDIVGTGTGNATLLAFSIIISSSSDDSELIDLLSGFSEDLKDDGILSIDPKLSQIYNSVQNLDLSEIRENIENKYSEIGTNVNIPDFESIIQLYLSSQKPFDIEVEVKNISCQGLSDGAIDITINEGTPPFNIQWSNNVTTEDLSELAPGLYSVYIVDANGYEMVMENIEVSQPDSLMVEVEVENASAIGLADGIIELSVTGGTPPYTFEWSNGANSSTIVDLEKGFYSVGITDSNSCSIDLDVVIMEPIEVDFDITNNDCFGETEGAINASIIGGLEPYMISWSNGSNDSSINELEAGFYSVTISDTLGFVGIYSAEVTQPDEIIVTENISHVSQMDLSDGSIGLEVSGGEAPYTFEWSTGSTNSNITNLTKGKYSVTVTDAKQCSKEFEYNVQEPIELAILKTDVSCYGESSGAISLQILGGLEPYDINWTNGSKSTELSDLFAGIFSVSVTDQLGFTISESVEITQPDMALSLSSTVTHPNETGTGLVEINVTGGTQPYSYAWSNSSTTDNSGDLTNGDVFDLNVVVTDANECTIESTFNLDNSFYDSRNNQTYSLIKIGDQIWFAENINYDIGDGSWAYDNDESNAETYGRLYNYNAALTICPDGWHLPTQNEWQTLENYIGGESNGGRLKATGTSLWVEPNTDASNEYGYNALPAGVQNGMPFESLGEATYFWSSTESNSGTTFIRSLLSVHGNFAESSLDQEFGISCRCLKDK